MGGRLMLTTIQVTLVFKNEFTEEEVENYMEALKSKSQSNVLFIEAYLDDWTTKDVEV